MSLIDRLAGPTSCHSESARIRAVTRAGGPAPVNLQGRCEHRARNQSRPDRLAVKGFVMGSKPLLIGAVVLLAIATLAMVAAI
jgi:hypothetical protein